MTWQTRLTTFRDTMRKVSPVWLQNGHAERLLYAIALITDALADGLVAGVKARFPGEGPDEALSVIGRERRIRRGRLEPAATYALRLHRWLDDHRRRGGPYALLGQLHAYYTPLNFPVELRYASGRNFVLSPDGTITRGEVVWTPPGPVEPAKWARWWLIYTWPHPIGMPKWGEPGRKWGDGSVWGADLTPVQVRDLRMVPREWGAGHAIGRITLITPSRTITISAEG